MYMYILYYVPVSIELSTTVLLSIKIINMCAPQTAILVV